MMLPNEIIGMLGITLSLSGMVVFLTTQDRLGLILFVIGFLIELIFLSVWGMLTFNKWFEK